MRRYLRTLSANAHKRAMIQNLRILCASAHKRSATVLLTYSIFSHEALPADALAHAMPYIALPWGT
eukprot:5579183-Pyramimonas_sp.AAC.1